MKMLLLACAIVLSTACSTTGNEKFSRLVEHEHVSYVHLADGNNVDRVYSGQTPFNDIQTVLWRVLLSATNPSIDVSDVSSGEVSVTFRNYESYYFRVMPDHHRILIESMMVTWPYKKDSTPQILVNEQYVFDAEPSEDSELLFRWAQARLNRQEIGRDLTVFNHSSKEL